MGIQIAGNSQHLGTGFNRLTDRQMIAQLEKAKQEVNSSAITNLKLYEKDDYMSAAFIEWANQSYDSGLSFADWIAEKQSQGLGAFEVDWDALVSDIQFATNHAAKSLEDSIDILDALASRYAVTRSHIEESYTGQQRTEALEQLDALFNERIEQIIERVVASYESKLGDYGIGKETDNISASLLAAYDSSKTNYEEYIKANPDYLGVRGTQDEWIQSLDSFASTALRKAVGPEAVQETAPQAAETGSQTIYTRTELKALDGLLRELSWNTYLNKRGTEEEIGFSLGNMAALITHTNNAINASDAYKAMTDKLMSNYVDHMIQQANDYTTALKNIPAYVVNDHSNDALINKDTVMNVYSTMLNAINNGKNIQEIWSTGLNAAKASYQTSRADPTYKYTHRYDDGRDANQFLSNFYEVTLSYTVVDPIGLNAPIRATGQEQLMYAWESYLMGLGVNSPFVYGNSIFEAYA